MLEPAFARAWQDLPEKLASELFAEAASHGVDAGETLFQAGDEVDGCYRLDKGVIKVSLASPKGEERILAVVSGGSIIEMIDGLTRTVSATALTDCELRFVSQESFQDFGGRHPEIYRYFVAVLAKRLRETENNVAALAFLTAKGRVARALLNLAESLGTKTGLREILIPQRINQHELASLAGVSRENTNRILRSWEQRKLLSKSLQIYRINDKEKLEREIE